MKFKVGDKVTLKASSIYAGPSLSSGSMQLPVGGKGEITLVRPPTGGLPYEVKWDKNKNSYGASDLEYFCPFNKK